MSAADGMFRAPSATSWACAAFSRASKAREMAPLTSGFSSRSWASLPERVLALAGEAVPQAVAAGFVGHAGAYGTRWRTAAATSLTLELSVRVSYDPGHARLRLRLPPKDQACRIGHFGASARMICALRASRGQAPGHCGRSREADRSLHPVHLLPSRDPEDARRDRRKPRARVTPPAPGASRLRMHKRKLLIGLTTAGLLLAGFGAATMPASAEQRTLLVTLVGGAQVTVTVDVPPGTPIDQIQIPGVSDADPQRPGRHPGGARSRTRRRRRARPRPRSPRRSSLAARPANPDGAQPEPSPSPAPSSSSSPQPAGSPNTPTQEPQAGRQVGAADDRQGRQA